MLIYKLLGEGAESAFARSWGIRRVRAPCARHRTAPRAGRAAPAERACADVRHGVRARVRAATDSTPRRSGRSATRALLSLALRLLSTLHAVR